MFSVAIEPRMGRFGIAIKEAFSSFLISGETPAAWFEVELRALFEAPNIQKFERGLQLG